MKGHRIDPGPRRLDKFTGIAANKICYESHSYASKMTVYGLNSFPARKGAYIFQIAGTDRHCYLRIPHTGSQIGIIASK